MRGALKEGWFTGSLFTIGRDDHRWWGGSSALRLTHDREGMVRQGDRLLAHDRGECSQRRGGSSSLGSTHDRKDANSVEVVRLLFVGLTACRGCC